jgi:hypothetical protein
MKLIISRLKALKSAGETFLTMAKDASVGGPVNWADLHVVSAEYAMDDEGNERYILTISEASPEAHELQSYLHTQFQSAGYEDVAILTEW